VPAMSAPSSTASARSTTFSCPSVLIGGKVQGYPITRLVANMEWALEDRPGVEDLVEYETRLNYVLPKYDDAVC
jgi:hypothetical protein